MSANLNNTTPAAPGGNVNVTWQKDSSGNVSAYIATGAGGLSKYTQTWTAQTSVTVAHGLGTTDVTVQAYNGGSPNLMIIPQDVQIVDANTVLLTFGGAIDGYVVVIG